jgi:rRNA-processing protein FCF1
MENQEKDKRNDNQGKSKKIEMLHRNLLYPDAESIFSFRPKLIEEIKDDCLVVIDTNSLLVPYTTGKSSLEQINKIYKLLSESNRLFIPGQVAREFADNRVVKLKELHQQISRKKKSSLNLGNYPLLEGLESYQKVIEIEKEISEKIREYDKQIHEILENISQWYWNDPVSLMYSSLFSKGVVLDVEIKEDVLRQRIEKDCEYKLPPGYKDASKPDMGVGDVIIWFTILEIGQKYKKSVIFVSLDQKADWWSQSEGSPLYPRFELVEEFRHISEGQSFHILKFSSFLNLYGASKEVIEEVRQEEVQSRIEHLREQPKIKLILLASEIEREVRFLLATMGIQEQSKGGILNNLKLLEPQGFSELEKADYFWSIRNQRREVNLDDISLAAEHGLSILKNLKSIQHQVRIVYHTGVSVYSDPDCKKVQELVKGLILEIRSHPGDIFVCFVVYPTTLNHFTKGKMLTSEWNMNNVWGESWYHDPETNEIKSAWGSAAEFIGRNLDEVL